MTITKSSTASQGPWDAPTGMPRGLVPSIGRDRRPSACGQRRRRRLEGGGARPSVGRGGRAPCTHGRSAKETLRRRPHIERGGRRQGPGSLPGKGRAGNVGRLGRLPHSAPCLTELAVIAHLYAESGSSKAEPLIEQLRNHLPTEAEALGGILPGGKGKSAKPVNGWRRRCGDCATIHGCSNIYA